MLRCGSVPFSDVGNPTVRFGSIRNPTVRFGTVFLFRKTYGALRCGFQEANILRCGVVRLTAPNRTEPIGKTILPLKTLDIYPALHRTYESAKMPRFTYYQLFSFRATYFCLQLYLYMARSTTFRY